MENSTISATAHNYTKQDLPGLLERSSVLAAAAKEAEEALGDQHPDVTAANSEALRAAIIYLTAEVALNPGKYPLYIAPEDRAAWHKKHGNK